jgi:co-chaperonin GroES (HSP10)
MEKVNPTDVRPLWAWVLLREDPAPTETTGGIIIPATSEYQGRRMVKGTVLRVGNGIGKQEVRWEMPQPGWRIVITILAHNPDTQKKLQELFKLEEDKGARYYMIHSMDILVSWDPAEGELEVA